MTGITFQKVSDSEIIVNWREPEMTNGLILHYIIRVTLYSTGHSVYTNMVSAGRGLSDVVTGLGKMHGSKLFWVDIVKIPLISTYAYFQNCKEICA